MRSARDEFEIHERLAALDRKLELVLAPSARSST
jgi:hypothetical protein